jgi:hypothetical protein
MKAKGYNMGGMMAPDASGPQEPMDYMQALKKKKKRPPMGAMSPMGMKKGGKVRGCGKAKQGVRKAKMVVMKGS